MKLLLFCMAALLLASDVELNNPMRQLLVSRAFNNPMNGIVPKIIPDGPKGYLDVCFGKAQANLGNEICTSDTVSCPDIKFDDVDPTCLYTVMIIDKDAPCVLNPYWRSWLVSLRVNVLGLDLKSGWVVAPYVPPSPPVGSGTHTIIVLLYRQSGTIFKDTYLNNLAVNRAGFNVQEFVKRYKLEDCPAAGNFFRVQYPNCFCKIK